MHELRGSNGHHVTLHTDPGVHLHTLQDKGATKHLAFEKPGTTAPRHIFWKPARGGATETHISWDPRVHHMQLPEYRAEHAGRVTYSLGMQGQGGEHSQALGLGQSQSARPHRGQVQHEVHGQGQHHGQGQSHYSQIQDQIQGQGQGQVLAAPEPARKKRAVLDRIRSRGGGAGSGGARGLLGRWKTGGWM